MDRVVHFEIPAEDTQRAIRFYTTVFGWEINKVPMPEVEYYMATTTPIDEQNMPKEAGAINGAITPKDNVYRGPVIVMNVASIEESIRKVEAAGGRLAQPKTEVGDFGLYSLVEDSEGNIIGLWQDVRR